MKISKAEIYGFGKWQQLTLDFSGKSFVVFVGENESGKSTLRQFFLFMFFGLPPQKRLQYLPKKGGQMGGKLTVESVEVGKFTIERFHDRNKGQAFCYDADGNQQDETWLTARLSSVNRSMFDKIFNFDSVSLQRIHHLEEKELGDVLLSIGMTGSDRIYWAEKDFDQRLQEQFKPQGKKPIINQLLSKIAEKAAQLDLLEKEVMEYESKQIEKIELQKQLEQHQSEREQLTQSEIQLKQHLHVKPIIEEWDVTNHKLINYPVEFTFPHNGIKRYQQLREQMYPLKGELESVERNMTDLQQKLSQAKKEIWEQDVVNVFEQILADSQTYHLNQNKLTLHTETKEKMITEINYELKQLQLGLTSEQLDHVPISFATEEIWLALREDQKDTVNEAEQLRNQEKLLAKEAETLLESIKQIEVAQIGRDQFSNGQSELTTLQTQYNQQQTNRVDDGRQQYFEKTIRNRKRFSIASALLFPVVSIASGFLGFTQANDYLIIMSGISLLMGVAIPLLQRQALRTLRLFIDDNNRTAPNLTTEEIDRLKELKLIIDQEENKIEKIITQKREHKQVEIERVKLVERSDLIEQEIMSIDKRILEQQNKFPFLQDVPLTHWPKLYQELVKIIGKKEELNNLSTEMSNVNEKLTSFEAVVLERTERYIEINKSDFSNVLVEIRQQINQQNNLAEQIEHWIDQHSCGEQQVRLLEAKITPYQQAINKLWQTAEVQDEESFLTRGGLFEEKTRLVEAKERYLQQIQVTLSEEAFDRIVKGENITGAELKSRLTNVVERGELIKQKMQETQQQIANNHALLVQLSQSRTLSDTKHAYYLLKNELQAEAKKWATYQLASEKIKQTKIDFQNRYLPDVLVAATYYFKRLTRDRYQRVFFADQENELFVEVADGSYYQLTELSQGTKDQLYIALRIALSQVMAKQIQLPFLIDDGFVHFDQKRANVVLTLFQEIAKEQQVIYFSKDANVISELSNKDNVEIINLSGNAFTSAVK